MLEKEQGCCRGRGEGETSREPKKVNIQIKSSRWKREKVYLERKERGVKEKKKGKKGGGRRGERKGRVGGIMPSLSEKKISRAKEKSGRIPGYA